MAAWPKRSRLGSAFRSRSPRPKRLELSGFGHPHHHHERAGSTNDLARELAIDGAPSGTVVTAGEQTAGRGRGERRWSAPPDKALLYSAILRPLDQRHLLLPLAVPLAVCEAAERVLGAEDQLCQVKWPNDVWLEQRKLAGILIEARPPQWAVIGVGINVAIEPAEFPEDLRWPATSLGAGHEIEEVREALDQALDAWVEAPPERVLAEFRARDGLRGRAISWQGEGSTPGSGMAEGIDDRGNLLVRSGEELVSLGSGEVHLTLE